MHPILLLVCIPSSASPHATAPLRPAVLPAERANFDSKDAPFLDPSRADGSYTRRDRSPASHHNKLSKL
ncbi:hypothetical protein HMPREF3185_00228 [Porphyromonas somerae]|uniref:Uncharacterized protein n=1 Tax=Porphyromonas somerae TaxID=322095 RepID=A0A134BE77_9PORP|nr:hypothetical protein HMPREF3184_00228 [Porphyromonadaceae bacterium KA00676]KXB78235.1 hypothetical protein HMPREF3185_00228 [Porphyromonas somerae]